MRAHPEPPRASAAGALRGGTAATLQTMTSGETTAIAATARSDFAAAVAVPIPAAATVPMNAACRRASAPSEPSLDIGALDVHRHVPDTDPQPSTSPATAGRMTPVTSPSAVNPRPILVSDPPSTPRAVPNRCTIGPESGSLATTRPTAQQQESQLRGRQPSASRTAGCATRRTRTRRRSSRM
jgi:hypothetical protein